jgi:hypothetical protein
MSRWAILPFSGDMIHTQLHQEQGIRVYRVLVDAVGRIN